MSVKDSLWFAFKNRVSGSGGGSDDGSGGSEALVVNLNYDWDENKYIPDKSFEEVANAHENATPIIAFEVADGMNSFRIIMLDGNIVMYFMDVDTESNRLFIIEITWENDDTITKSVARYQLEPILL